MARKCTLSARVPLPGSNIVPPDTVPEDMTRDMIEKVVLGAFFHDYCLVPPNAAYFRGFLGGLEPMVRRLGLQSQVSRACCAVAFANHGLKLNRPLLVRKAEMLYYDLLKSLAHAIECPEVANREEIAVMAILLGLYEMIMAGNTDLGNHRAHAGGLAALLKIKNNPLALLEAVGSGRSLLGNKSQDGGMFSPMCSRGRGKDLDSLLVRLMPVFKEAEALLSRSSGPFDFDRLGTLKEDAAALSSDLAHWQQAQTAKVKPATIGHITMTTRSAKSSPEAGYWPVRVDKYCDFYFAAIWNISRTARCLLISIMIQVSDILNDSSNRSTNTQDLHLQVEGILASIPYHLTEDVETFLRNNGRQEISNAGRAAGGLLLMHPIYALSKLPGVSPEMREYMRKCLAWIGRNMGVGQASLLANGSGLDREYVTSGWMIIWAALLV
ncbi:putative C6 transcription factor [Aspergillus lucknowensis]|uniref:Uncharacterized protein n=1 Tax=Aspergillus lucknowensis TaxID=176173 RepID=A0ABR4LTC9_9EURO